MKILILGATGLVGSSLLEQALKDSRISQVVAPVRRELAPHPKLIAPVVDFESLPDKADWWQVDAVLCALGTTIKVAGSEEAFARVDLEYPLLCAEKAQRHGASIFVLNSAVGANKASAFFYSRIKGQLEEALEAMQFSSLVLVRPGLIGGERKEKRTGEEFLSGVLKVLNPILPKKMRINPASKIAQVMLDAAVQALPGKYIIASDQLVSD